MTRPSRDIDARRRMVASMLLQGFALDLITEGLAGQFANRRTGKPYTRNSVYRDIVALRAQWREAAADDIADLRGRQFAELALTRKKAWESGDLDIVLRALAQEAKLLGINKPEQLEIQIRDRAISMAERTGLNSEELLTVARNIAKGEEMP